MNTGRQIELLLDDLPEHATFSSTFGQVFVMLANRCHQTVALHDPAFRDWLANRHLRREGTPPSEAVLNEVIKALRADACLRLRNDPALRVGSHEDSLYIDLANAEGEAVEINSRGIQVTNSTPGFVFRSARGQLSLPKPAAPTVDPPASALPEALTPWILAALQPTGPYPILILHGPPGSGKTTVARLLRRLLDPVAAPVTSLPPRERAIGRLALSNRVLAFDHVTKMSESAADALCRIASGTGVEIKEHGERRNPLMFEVARPIILTTPRNGLNDWQPRPDLAARAITIHMHKIENPRPQKEIEAEFEQLLPAIQAYIYAKYAKNETRSIPNDQNRAREELNTASAQSDPLYAAITQLTVVWTGTATDLQNKFPQICVTPRSLSHRLHFITPTLAQAGIQVEHHRKHNGERQITIRSGPGT